MEFSEVITNGRELSISVPRALKIGNENSTYLSSAEVKTLKKAGAKTMLYRRTSDGAKIMAEQILIQVSSYEDALNKFNNLFPYHIRKRIDKTESSLDYFGLPYSQIGKF